mmetsp:Transcript_28310/g.65647  ORF Transcript_28310/g.65647 Transcript_28310/m.65647 type:complete len:289 (+) Transcript_28310:52-918(+)
MAAMYSNNVVLEGPNPSPKKGVDIKRLQDILARFEVSIADANDLVALEDYRIVLVCDDSGSMQQSAVPKHMRQLGQDTYSRWQEMQSTASLVLDIGQCFNPDGVDVYFLNRAKVANVKGSEDKRFVFACRDAPKGSTPLTRVVTQVVQECGGEKPVLLMILTDGVPDGGPRPFIRAVKDVVAKRSTPHTFKFQVMACTPEDDDVEWLNVLDRELPQVDVTDDYHTERMQVLKAGKCSNFTRGDWCMKALLGPVSHKFDGWDESKTLFHGKTAYLEDQCKCEAPQCSIQ